MFLTVILIAIAACGLGFLAYRAGYRHARADVLARHRIAGRRPS
jgi:ABC-type methionine transport system permease subunit